MKEDGKEKEVLIMNRIMGVLILNFKKSR